MLQQQRLDYTMFSSLMFQFVNVTYTRPYPLSNIYIVWVTLPNLTSSVNEQVLFNGQLRAKTRVLRKPLA